MQPQPPVDLQILVVRIQKEGCVPTRAEWTGLDGSGNDMGSLASAAPVATVGAAALAQAAPGVLDAAELARASRLKHPQDRQTYMGVHVLLRQALARRLACEPQALQFRAGNFGKPVLAGAPGVHFSLSYRRGWGAMAIAASPVGIDIETMRPGDDLLELARRWFHADEAAFLAQQEGPTMQRVFLELWTRKEALIKAAGLGVDHMPATSALKSLAPSMDESGTARMYGVRHFESTGQFALALALAIQQ